MKRTVALAFALVLLLAAPASADVSANPGTVEAGEAAAITFRVPNETSEAPADDSGDDGADGTDLATFAALELGGVALVAAMAALIMGRRRIPS